MILCSDQRPELVELAERDVESALTARELWATLRSGAPLRVESVPVCYEGHLEGTESWSVKVREPHKLPEDVCEALRDPWRIKERVAILDLFLLLWQAGARAHAATLLDRAHEEQRHPTPVYEGGVYVCDSRTTVRLPRVAEYPDLPWETEASDIARGLRDLVHFERGTVPQLAGWRLEWARWYAGEGMRDYVRRVEEERADLATCEEWRREHVAHFLGQREELLARWRVVVESLAS